MDISGAQLFHLIISVYLIYYLKTMETYLEVAQKFTSNTSRAKLGWIKLFSLKPEQNEMEDIC